MVLMKAAGAWQVKPFVKWAGGKGQLLEELLRRVPGSFNRYYEPFVGGGALFFALRPREAILADKNEELMNAYLVVRDHVDELVASLKRHRHDRDYYYRLRSHDPRELDRVERASRFIYLNKTCYNGLWRVNRRGRFNVPFGRYKAPRICDEENLRAASLALRGAQVSCGDFAEALAGVTAGDFVYLDPPYHPVSSTAHFTAYVGDGFGEEEQRRLADVFRELDRRGCKVLLSNSDTELIRSLYEGYEIETVSANRCISCRGDGRRGATELIISNQAGDERIRN